MSAKSAVILDNREKGQFPLSIATSLAFEGAFGIYPERPQQKVLINDYQEVWLNIRTLFRNIHGSMKKEDEARLSATDYAMAIREEMTIVQSVLDDHTRGRVRAYFYACDYRSLKAHYPHANLKEDNTDRQKHYSAMENRALDALGIELKGLPQQYIHFDTTIKGNKKKALFITHYPLDLLSNTDFEEIGLLESHSGVVKHKSEWYTKLHNGKSLVRLPFNKMTIQMFGDSGGLFAPYPQEYRKALLEVADKHQWTPMTTKDRILLTVGLTKMPTLIGTVQKMF